jgi:uncharacterized protein (DUF433 family)
VAIRAVSMATTETERNLVARWIEPNPHRPGVEDAILVDYGVSVWALIGYLAMVENDVARVAADYEIPLEAVEAALAYYQEHKSAIDARLAANLA